MPKRKRFVINRAVWLRGKNEAHGGMLLNDEGRMCCLGIYLKACGAKPLEIYSKLMPFEVTSECLDRIGLSAWITNPEPLTQLAEVNDDETMTERERESQIRCLFQQLGVRVTFTGENGEDH